MALSVSRCTKTSFNTFSNVMAKTEGASKVSELFFHFISLAAWIKKKMPESFSNVDLSLRTFHGWTSGISFLRKVADWMGKDENGKRVWQKDIVSLLFSISITAYYGLSFVRYLGRIKVLKIAKAAPIIGNLVDVATLASCVTDIWISARDVIKSNKEIKNAKNKIFEWKWNNSGSDVTYWNKITCLNKIAKWNGNGLNIKTNESKVKQWTILKECTYEEAKQYCSKQVERYQAIERNAKQTKFKSWAYIAFDIAIIATMAIALLASGSILALIIASIVVSVLEVGCFALDTALKPEVVPEVKLPPRLLLQA